VLTDDKRTDNGRTAGWTTRNMILPLPDDGGKIKKLQQNI